MSFELLESHYRRGRSSWREGEEQGGGQGKDQGEDQDGDQGQV